MNRTVIGLSAAMMAALSLAACNKPSAVSGQGGSAPAAYGATADAAKPGTAYGASYASADPRDRPVPQVDGKPMWAANRSHTAEENAQYQFAKNGADFGAANESDYVRKAHAFVERPPKDVDTISRSNGDKVMYSAAGNVFAVVNRDGAPRTMFKPRDGASYWAQQKAEGANGYRSAYRGSDRGYRPGGQGGAQGGGDQG